MKKLILFSAFLFLIFFANAQNWQLVKSNKVQWYTYSNNALAVIFADSVKLINQDSVFYFPVRIGLKQKYWFSDRYYYVNIKAPWWTGEKMIYKPDGTQLFFSSDKDTIVLQTNKPLYEEWKIVRFASGNYIKGKIISAGIDSISGSTDSTKTIQFQAYSKFDVLIPSHALNDRRIKISKNNGFVELFPLLSVLDTQSTERYSGFGLDPYKLSTKGKRLAIRDVYGFEKGDEFQRENYPSKRILTVIYDKEDLGDIIKYKVGKLEDLTFKTYDMSAMFYSDEAYDHCKNLFTDRYPGQYSFKQSGNYKNEFKVYYYQLNACGLVTVYISSISLGSSKDTFEYSSFEAETHYNVYTDHLGLTDSVHTNWNGFPWENYNYKLNYVKSKYCNFGINPIPYVPTPAEPVYLIGLKPNPAINDLLLSYDVPITNTRIFNAVGQEIGTDKAVIDSRHISFDVSKLSPGIYFLNVNDRHNLKFIKVK